MVIGICCLLVFVTIYYPSFFHLNSCFSVTGARVLCGCGGLVAGLRAFPATGWSYFLGLGLQGFVCPGHLTAIFATKLLMVIRNTYPNHGHSSDFLCFLLINY